MTSTLASRDIGGSMPGDSSRLRVASCRFCNSFGDPGHASSAPKRMFGRMSPDPLEAALLSLILARHPAPVHAEELARAFAGDDWETAVTELEADGILHREGRLHLATRAAVRVSRLLE